MLTVYCDTGAYLRELAALEKSGCIQLVQWKYENKNDKIRVLAPPSKPTWEQAKVTWEQLRQMVWSDLSRQSEKWPELIKLIGAGHRVDAQHLDSAFMAQCDAFLTTDKDDILRFRDEIESLLEFRVFHIPSEWEQFASYAAKGND